MDTSNALTIGAVFALTAACATTPDSAGSDAPVAGREEAGRSAADAPNGGQASNGPNDSGDHAGYDMRLSSYEYPYEVKFFEVDAQRQTLQMAYMHVMPDGDRANGHAVLLLHGKNFSGAYWKSTIEALVDQGYEVVVPDQIGFGKSSKPRHFQFSFHALATYTKGLLDELGVEHTSVVGHSMGGMVATRFSLMFPDTVERLALVNPIGLEDWKRVVPYHTVEERYRDELKKTPAKVKAYMTQSYFDGQWKPAYKPLVEIQAGWIKGPDYKRIAWESALTYDMIFTQPVVYEFDDLKMPALLIIGQRDRTALGKSEVSAQVRKTLGRYDQLDQKVADMIPDSTLVEIPGVGHIPQFEAYDQYIEALSTFLAAPQSSAEQ